MARSAQLPVALYVCALALTFGYEVFSFHLSIDEELAGDLSASAYAHLWVGQGRWGMGLLTLALPNPVTPVVSAGLGVGLFGLAWWLICRRTLGFGRWTTAACASLVATIPIFAFMYSFATIAYGIGVGGLLVFGFAEGIRASRWRFRVLGLFAGVASISIYDTFVAVLAVFALALVLQRHSLRASIGALVSVVLAFVLSRGIGSLVSWAIGTPQTTYVSGVLDFRGLIADPRARIAGSIDELRQVFIVQDFRFGLSSPFLPTVIIALAVLAVIASLVTARGVKGRLISFAATLLLLVIPFASQAISPVSVPVRSLLYVPAIVLVLAYLARRLTPYLPTVLRRTALATLAALVLLSVLGNATISNRLFAASETNYHRDQMLAFGIGQQVELQSTADTPLDLALVVSGAHGWSSTVVTPVRDVMGASFFQWDGGSAKRMAAFLRTQGLNTHAGTTHDVKATAAALARMPDYPADGWVRVLDGRLLLKFGPKTAFQ